MRKSVFQSLKDIYFIILFCQLNKKTIFWTLSIFSILSGLAEGLFIFYISPLISKLLSLGSSGADNTVLSSLILITILILLATTLRLFCLYLSSSISAQCGTIIVNSLISKRLYMGYENLSSDSLAKRIALLTKHVDYTCLSVELAFQGVNSLIIVASISIGLLFNANPLTLLPCISIFMVYLIISTLAFPLYVKYSKESAEIVSKIVNLVRETYQGYRDIILDQLYSLYSSKITTLDFRQRRIASNSNFIKNSPRLFIEGTGIVLIVLSLIFVYFAFSNSSFLNYVASIGSLAIGFQRLLPVAQSLYSMASSLSIYSADMRIVKDALVRTPSNTTLLCKSNELLNEEFISIELDNFSLSYSQDKIHNILLSSDFKLNRGERLGLVGPSGSGKSSFLNILMGILPPTSGNIVYNGHTVLTTLVDPAWHLKVSHVSQSPFIFNASIASNISLEFNTIDIDYDKLSVCLSLANIAKWVEGLPLGYDTILTENGYRLSGGQIQRLAIARALYKDSPILIFDEPTSALDDRNTDIVLSSIFNLPSSKTIIIVTHDLNILHGCNDIYTISESILHKIV